jgi:hypothetical protein
MRLPEILSSARKTVKLDLTEKDTASDKRIWRYLMASTDETKDGQIIDTIRYVNFNNTKLCSDCNPVSCTVNGDDVPVGTWRDLLIRLIDKFTIETPDRINELYRRPLLLGSSRPFLLKDRPNGAAKQTSTGHWVYVNLNISALVDLIGKLCQHCGVSLHDVKIAYASKYKPEVDTVFYIDFANTGACSGIDPISCYIKDVNIPFIGNWRDLVVAISEFCILEFPEKTDELKSRWFSSYSDKPYFLIEKPPLSGKKISNGYWINVNYGISQLVAIIARLLRYCDVNLSDVKIAYAPKLASWSARARNERQTVSAPYAQQNVRNDFKTWLTEQHPEWRSSTVSMHYSDAYYLYNNNLGVTLKEALTAEDGIQQAYDAIERFYIDNPTQTNKPSRSARSYIRSLRMLKEFLKEKYPTLCDTTLPDKSVTYVLNDAVIEVLKDNYALGFRFDTTYINLLSSATGIEINGQAQLALKRIMFRRNDDIYFLLDTIADAETRENIVEFADAYLQEYGCFEIPEFYKIYEDKVNPNCIRNADDFEEFFKQIGKSCVRCVSAPQFGNRIARYSSGSVWSTFGEVATKIAAVIKDEYYGSCNEEDLYTKFCAFSTDLLGKIIKHCAEGELIRVEINESVCYQTFDALGLPENFSDILSEILENLVEIGLELTQDVLHTAISIKLGMNFKEEYNLPDWDTYRRLVSKFYKAEPKREWRYNNFGEVAK